MEVYTNDRSGGDPGSDAGLAGGRGCGPVPVLVRDDQGARAVAPPVSNTGAHSPSSPVVRDIVDWIALTFPDKLEDGTATDEALSEVLDVEEWVTMPYGASMYNRVRVAGAVSLLDGGRGDNKGTVHLSLSGSACRELEQRGVIPKRSDVVVLLPDGTTDYAYDWQGFCSYMQALGGHASRVDLSRDDFSGLVDLPAIEAAWYQGAISTRYKGMDPRHPVGRDGQYQGYSLYFGSAQSGTRLTLYDKHIEQTCKGAEDVPERWIRAELRCRKQKAEQAFLRLSAEGLSWIAGAILGVLDVKERPLGDDEAHPERVASVTWWRTFTTARENIVRLVVDRVVKRLEEAVGHAERQCGAVLAALVEVAGGDLAPILGILHRGRERWRPKHWAQMAAYRVLDVGPDPWAAPGLDHRGGVGVQAQENAAGDVEQAALFELPAAVVPGRWDEPISSPSYWTGR